MKTILTLITLCLMMCTRGYSQNTNNVIIVLPPPPVNYTPYFPTDNYPRYEDSRAYKKAEQQIQDNMAKQYQVDHKWVDDQMAKLYHCKTTVNLRQGKGTEHNILAILDVGTDLWVVSKGGEWWEVYYPGERITGYVHSSLIYTLHKSSLFGF